jgi:hypothetical protein
LADVLPTIGRNLNSLRMWHANVEAWMTIHSFCPNLECLSIIDHDVDGETTLASLNGGLKKRLKRLASLKVDDVSYRLGTDWAGYSEIW